MNLYGIMSLEVHLIYTVSNDKIGIKFFINCVRSQSFVYLLLKRSAKVIAIYLLSI